MVATFPPAIYRLANVRVLLALAAIFGVVSAQAGRGTLAFFTDVATSSGNTFTTGTIDIALAGGSGSTNCTSATYTSGADPEALGAVLTATAKKPGDISTVDICVKNVSTTLTTRWSLASSVSDNTSTNTALESLMKIAIWKAASNTAACATVWDAAGTYTAPTGDTELYGSNGTTTLATNPSIATQAATELPTSSSQKVCFSVVLPSSASDSDPAAATTVQGKVVTGDFTFTGTNL